MKKLLTYFIATFMIVAANILYAQVEQDSNESGITPAEGCQYTGDFRDTCFDYGNGNFYTIYRCKFTGSTTCGYYS